MWNTSQWIAGQRSHIGSQINTDCWHSSGFLVYLKERYRGQWKYQSSLSNWRNLESVNRHTSGLVFEGISWMINLGRRRHSHGVSKKFLHGDPDKIKTALLFCLPIFTSKCGAHLYITALLQWEWNTAFSTFLSTLEQRSMGL